MSETTFSKRLQRAIDSDPKLTVAGLAIKAGLDNSALRSLLSGRVKNPRLDTAIRVCKALGTTLEDFMSGAFQDSKIPADEEDQRIRDLLSQLTIEERRHLATYGEGLRDARQLAQTTPDPSNE